jgi:hypothetical protein
MTGQPLQLRDALTEALGYWEPRRIAYNGALTVVVLTHAIQSWSAGDFVLSVDTILRLFVLAVLANAAYCAA